MLAHEQIRLRMNMAELPNYLTYSMTAATLFDNILQTRARTFLRLTKAAILYRRILESSSNSSSLFCPSDSNASNQTDIEQEIMRTSPAVVKDRMMMMFLAYSMTAAWLDSGPTMAVIAELMNRPVDTFSVGF